MNECIFNGECLIKGVYKATVDHMDETKENIGSTIIPFNFKARYSQHEYSLKTG